MYRDGGGEKGETKKEKPVALVAAPIQLKRNSNQMDRVVPAAAAAEVVVVQADIPLSSRKENRMADPPSSQPFPPLNFRSPTSVRALDFLLQLGTFMNDI